ncbi:kinase [Pseudodesulfovibrio sediminis]|uniref:GHMP kinase n=1 Tax=Pseudodesulfovibrio sediminis TaxID=2810563 RepID=A0ABM7P3T0_9BACT|nr:kinase [Pseudodesulfovibrio sediminis]BCS87504.1 GHMP kinase [Pseudodesulfovibrio sediminis]
MEFPNTIDEIIHPSVRECFRYANVEQGLEVNHSGDIPAMSGVGSSSAFTVGLLNALNALSGRICSKRELASAAIHVEQNMIGENVGSQDQVAAAFGGLNLVEFDAQREYWVEILPLHKQVVTCLQNNLLLFYTGISRFASNIAGEQIDNAKKNKPSLTTMREMAYEAARILTDCPVDKLSGLDDFGRLMHESWMLKRGLGSKVTNSTVDDMYAVARANGALGGKLCGAGGGGFLMLYVRPEDQVKVIEAMGELLSVPFEFENLGSHVTFYTR